ncbi:MAG: homocysteine S-methyltransferase [Halioglobus sp.]|jgi:homocysteine S-methyltransferase
MTLQSPLKRVMLLDGGLATELEARGQDLSHPLWSARLLIEDPQVIIDAHLAYLNAGAQCIITASYQASHPGFVQLGYTQAQATDALLLSVELAQKAISAFLNTEQSVHAPRIAASIGPYGAYLSDGSEYRGDYGVTLEQLVEFHAPRMEILSSSEANFLACETIPSLLEAQALNTVLRQQDKPAWVSFSCADGGHLHDGTRIADAAKVFADNEKVFAIGVNCTPPQHMPNLISCIKTSSEKAIVVYPNSGEFFDAKTKTWHGTSSPDDCAKAAMSWVQSGATLIGGCCRMGPEHIAAMKAALDLQEP